MIEENKVTPSEVVGEGQAEGNMEIIKDTSEACETVIKDTSLSLKIKGNKLDTVTVIHGKVFVNEELCNNPVKIYNALIRWSEETLYDGSED